MLPSGLGAHLPATVHPSDAEAGVATAVGQADFEFRAGIHHAAEDEGGKSHGPVDQIADGVRQVIALGASHDQRWPSLMDEDQRPHTLRLFPKGQKLGFVEGAAVDMVVDHGALQAQLHHGPL